MWPCLSRCPEATASRASLKKPWKCSAPSLCRSGTRMYWRLRRFTWLLHQLESFRTTWAASYRSTLSGDRVRVTNHRKSLLRASRRTRLLARRIDRAMSSPFGPCSASGSSSAVASSFASGGSGLGLAHRASSQPASRNMGLLLLKISTTPQGY